VLPSEELVEQRMERQEILVRDNPPVLDVLLDESVLYRKVGGPEVMRGALTHLIKMAGEDDIIVRIVPLSGNIKRFAYTFVLASLDSGKQLAYLDSARKGRIEEDPAEITELRRMWAHFGGAALSQEASIEMIQNTIDERWSAP
jgi:hypothetical protein